MKILFVNPFGIGDVLFTTTLIRPLREKGNSLYYWCNERVADVLRHNEAIERLFCLSRGDLKKLFKKSPVKAVKKAIELIWKIKKEKFDIALDFSLDYRYSLLLWLLGVKKIVGFDYKGRGHFLSDKVKIEGFSGRHMVKHYEALLRFIDGSIEPHDTMELFIGDEEKKWADEFLSRHGIENSDILIGISPGGGTSWGESAFRKRWPKEKFAYLTDEFCAANKYKIILFGNEEEKPLCDFIYKERGNKIINLCGKITLGQFSAILGKCAVLITNDGGPLHIAVALGVKTVSIFGPVDEKVYGPYPPSENHKVITAKVECRPCYKNFRYAPCLRRKCLESIEPSIAISAVRTILKPQ